MAGRLIYRELACGIPAAPRYACERLRGRPESATPISAEGRRSIARAQRRRWARFKRENATSGTRETRSTSKQARTFAGKTQKYVALPVLATYPVGRRPAAEEPTVGR